MRHINLSAIKRILKKKRNSKRLKAIASCWLCREERASKQALWTENEQLEARQRMRERATKGYRCIGAVDAVVSKRS